jgi:predicted enzyme related to lactoylglutathione lyase
VPERDGYIQGVPCWIDTSQPDPKAAADFYGALFGWELEDVMPPDAPGEYFMARIRGLDVAAVGSIPEGAPQMATWNTYVWVDSADDTAGKVKEAGGSVVMEPFDVMGAGRMSFVADPSGAFVGLWQAGRHVGSELTNVPGAITWHELVTTDAATALPFYEKVLGLTSEAVPFGPDYSYTMLTVDGRQVGGSTAPQADGVPNHWNVWFATADADATAGAATALGGTVLVGPMDMPVGRMVVIRDPQGGVINVLQSGDQRDVPDPA